MSSLITLSKNFLFFPSSSSMDKNLCPDNLLSMSLSIPPRTQLPPLPSFPPLHLIRQSSSLGFSCLLRTSSVKMGCGNKAWESEGDPDLEAEVMEFMKNSLNPNSFPTKEQLIIGGRFDLVKRIVKQGGWLSMGWGLDDDEEAIRDVYTRMGNEGSDSRIFQNRFDGECNSIEGFEAGNSGGGGGGGDGSGGGGSSSLPSSSNYPPSSSGRMEGGENGGIAGILSRLQKERTWSFGSKDKETKDLKFKNPQADGNGNSSSLEGSSDEDLFNDSGGSMKAFKPDLWRTWSKIRAGNSEGEFEAAEFGANISKSDEIVEKGGDATGNLKTELSPDDKEKDYNYIKTRLRELESELSSVLRSLGRQTDLGNPDKVVKRSSEESQALSDACEFRETEIMKARDKLRSMRAQVAVLEGKMALQIIEAQKTVVVKQKKLNNAHKALTQLRTASVTWHKSASEVLLVGSFDGWTSQRKMHQSSPGVFSLHLRLYPGRYEIKFIVDGVWMIDPLRLVVTDNNGYQNNLLLVS